MTDTIEKIKQRLDPRAYTPEQIRAAALPIIREYPTAMADRRGRWPTAIFIIFGVSRVLEPERHAATRGTWPGDRFGSKVKRVLDAMVAEGILVKGRMGSQAIYATAEYAAQCEGAKVALALQTEAGDERFKRIVKRAATHGLEIGGNRNDITLSLDDMERIIDRLEEHEDHVHVPLGDPGHAGRVHRSTGGF